MSDTTRSKEVVGMDAETLTLALETIREYGRKHLTHERLIELDAKNECPGDILKDLYDPEKVAIMSLMIPEAYGGMGGSSLDLYRVVEALARFDLGVTTSVFATYLGMDPILVGGTEAQKKKWIGKIADTQCHVAYGATEAAAGSDLLRLQTRAERVMEGDKVIGYTLNGGKMWITNGGIAGVYTILARSAKGVSWFVMEKGTPGLTSGKHEDKHGIRLSDTTPLYLKDVFVPAENLIGEVEGKGLRQAQAVFGYTRLMVASMALGAGWQALEHAIRYSQVRLVGGIPLSNKQGFTHKLIIPFVARLEACRAYIEEVSRRLDGGEVGLQTEGAVAKLLASETANRAADNAIQAYGGNGYVREFPVEKIKRDVKITCIYEGTSEVLELTVFRERWQHNLNAEGRYYDKTAEEMDALHAKDPGAGAAAAAVALRALSRTLKACHEQKLTHNQIVMMKLGELICYAESAAAFCRAAAQEKHSDAVVFDRDTWRAMSRIHARHAASRITGEGSALVAGAGEAGATNPAEGLAAEACAKVQAGDIADMDLVAKNLPATIKA